MKKTILKSLMIILCLPIFLMSFCACSDGSIDTRTYFSSVKATLRNNKTASVSFDNILSSKVNVETVDEYYSFDLVADYDWIYKFYLEKLDFMIYSVNALDSEVVVTLTITNAVDESLMDSDLSELKDEQKTYSSTRSFRPTENGNFNIVFENINQVLGVANGQTGSTITIDISEYFGGQTGQTQGNIKSFVWTIYGLKIFGGPRTYA